MSTEFPAVRIPAVLTCDPTKSVILPVVILQRSLPAAHRWPGGWAARDPSPVIAVTLEVILLFNCQLELVPNLAKFHPALGRIRVVPDAVKIIGYN